MLRRTRFVAIAVLVSWCLAAWPGEAAAQRRAIRRTPARPVVIVSPRVYYPGFHDPFFYRPFYGGFYRPYFFGWYDWYGQYPYPPYPYRYRVYDRTGAARLEVEPREAEVYVDGYFVGLVDDFDGALQRLRVEAGEHELQIYLEGYRTFTQKVLFTPGTTLKITHAMEPLGPGEANQPKPEPDAVSRTQHDPSRRVSRQYGRARPSDFGTLSLRVQPIDAVVTIDGEEWERPEGEDQFVVDLPAGTHRLEVRKEGFRTYAREIQVRPGQTLTLNVSLTTGGNRLRPAGEMLQAFVAENLDTPPTRRARQTSIECGSSMSGPHPVPAS